MMFSKRAVGFSRAILAGVGIVGVEDCTLGEDILPSAESAAPDQTAGLVRSVAIHAQQHVSRPHIGIAPQNSSVPGSTAASLAVAAVVDCTRTGHKDSPVGSVAARIAGTDGAVAAVVELVACTSAGIVALDPIGRLR
ncbi:hypothetical protein ACH5RR_037927 [Cinchona calisaya]|uniref:Uncharacterized protein n=1 Tax=Cinchona calisaya TaxID=153742 RepID=A0ABD2YD38_9GENT